MSPNLGYIIKRKGMPHLLCFPLFGALLSSNSSFCLKLLLLSSAYNNTAWFMMHAHNLACIKSQICALTRGKQKVKSEKWKGSSFFTVKSGVNDCAMITANKHFNRSKKKKQKKQDNNQTIRSYPAPCVELRLEH
jgi:hypothetical protein